MNKIVVVLLICSCFTVSMKGNTPAASNTMEEVADKQVLSIIADKLVKQADLKFIDKKTGKEYSSTKGVPANADLKFKNKFCNWHYTNGVLNIAMIHLSDYLNDPSYFEFARKHIAFGFDNYQYFEKRYNPQRDGNHWKYPLGELFNTKEMDDFGAMISSTIDEYQHVKGDKRADYLAYANSMGKFMKEKKLRHTDATFVRNFPNANTLWGDDLYMSVPFLARMTNLTGDQSYMNDAILQCINFDNYLWDKNREIYYHAYFTDLKRNSVAHWGRCNGWIVLAKVNLLSYMPKDHPQRQQIIDLLDKQIVGLSRYQSLEGVWHQVLDKSDSYLESSSSAMFVYAIAKSVNEGWIDKRYATVALTGWEGLKKHMITADGDMKNICEGTEVHDDLQYYYQRPCGINEKHGLGILIDAGIEITKLKGNNPQLVKATVERVHLNQEVQ
ncbi:MAG: glycoside hydrolase family 88/105 protein [Bacteroidales bacterium]